MELPGLGFCCPWGTLKGQSQSVSCLVCVIPPPHSETHRDPFFILEVKLTADATAVPFGMWLTTRLCGRLCWMVTMPIKRLWWASPDGRNKMSQGSSQGSHSPGKQHTFSKTLEQAPGQGRLRTEALALHYISS